MLTCKILLVMSKQKQQSTFNTVNTINPPVFIGATCLIFVLLCYTVLFPEQASTQFGQLQSSIMVNASWFYVMAVGIILLSVICLGLSRYGDIKLGPDHAEPAFSFGSWFAMLFSAGMGIGLMFFGVAEPAMHFLNPPVGSPATVEAAKEAMRLTFFHWGLHAWAIYAIVALILAYFGYRHGLSLTLRSALYPVIGDRIYGVIGHLIDIFAILGTIFGVATALGYGVLQVNSGMNYLFGVDISTNIQVVLVVVITALATLSVASGLDKGIRFLSEANLLLAVLLLLMILVLGPTVLLLQMFVQNTGSYLSDIISKTFNLYAYEPNDFLGGWTLFYWSWWLSWSPFVGMFIARISRGRTIRQFVMGVLVVPTALTLIWMTVFGNTAIDLILNKGVSTLAHTVDTDAPVALFVFLESFPFSNLLSIVAIGMVVIFFVTSSDSSAMVVDMLASGGSSKTPVWQRVYWSSLIGVVAMVLLLAGGLQALQAVTIASALPFSIIVLIALYGLLKALALDVVKRESLVAVVSPPLTGHKPIHWRDRLSLLVSYPKRRYVKQFLQNTVLPAMESVSNELQRQGVESKVKLSNEKDATSLVVQHGEEIDFFYKVRPRAYLQPSFMVTDTDTDDEEHQYFRAEVFLREGGQGYDIMGWTKDQVIGDIVDQYEKHMHFLHLVR